MFFSRRGTRNCGCDADVAQLVERNLAKVEVAGSSPVARSVCRRRDCGVKVKARNKGP